MFGDTFLLLLLLKYVDCDDVVVGLDIVAVVELVLVQ